MEEEIETIKKELLILKIVDAIETLSIIGLIVIAVIK